MLKVLFKLIYQNFLFTKYLKFIEKRGEGLHHLAFAVNNIEKSLETVEEKGVRLIDKTPRKGAEGLHIGFLHPKSTFGTLTEFCEKKS